MINARRVAIQHTVKQIAKQLKIPELVIWAIKVLK